MERVPAVEGLFTEKNGKAELIGSRCATCKTAYFPRAGVCHNPKCDHSEIEEFRFGGRGKLWSYSVQNFPPPPPHKFDQPYKIYALGVVDFADCGLRLMGQMQVENFDAIKIGGDVELVIDALYHENDKEYTSWKFKPIA